MNKHVMAGNILLDKNYQREARKALAALRLTFIKKIDALKKAYRNKEIGYDELESGRKALLQELAAILTTHPGDDPRQILSKLIHYADRHSQEIRRFSAKEYIAGLAGRPLPDFALLAPLLMLS